MIDPAKLPSGGIWIPAARDNSDWLLITLHGSGGSGQDFVGLEDIFNLPNLNYLFLHGPIRDYSGYRWYSDLGGRKEAYLAIRRAIEFTMSEGFPSNRIFLMGFSQGAALAIEFGVRFPYLLAGYIAISGRIENLPGLFSYGDPSIIKRGRWLVTHGTRDYNLSVDIMRQQAQQMVDGGFHVDYREYDKIHEFDSKRELPEIRNWILDRMGQSS